MKKKFSDIKKANEQHSDHRNAVIKAVIQDDDIAQKIIDCLTDSERASADIWVAIETKAVYFKDLVQWLQRMDDNRSKIIELLEQATKK